jgi:hypothetical protein
VNIEPIPSSRFKNINQIEIYSIKTSEDPLTLANSLLGDSSAENSLKICDNLVKSSIALEENYLNYKCSDPTIVQSVSLLLVNIIEKSGNKELDM